MGDRTFREELARDLITVVNKDLVEALIVNSLDTNTSEEYRDLRIKKVSKTITTFVNLIADGVSSQPESCPDKDKESLTEDKTNQELELIVRNFEGRVSVKPLEPNDAAQKKTLSNKYGFV